jgi:hypothetical protein
MTKLAGGRLCGAVRCKINGKPKFAVSCHCRDCQYVSGGAPAHAVIMRNEHVTITKGAAKEQSTLSEKGNRIARLFCEQCGTSLFAKNASHPEFLPVKVGSLDDPSSFRPHANIWTRPAQPWHFLDAAVPQFERDPAMGTTALFEIARSSLVRFGRMVGLLSRQSGRRPFRVPG